MPELPVESLVGHPIGLTESADTITGTIEQLTAYTGVDYWKTRGLILWLLAVGLAHKAGKVRGRGNKKRSGYADVFSIPRRLQWTFEAKS
jgi:hypothetical protein